MKKLTLIVFGLSILLTTKSQETKVYQSFENLTELKLPIDHWDLIIKYDPSNSYIIAKQYIDLDSDYNGTFSLDETDGCDSWEWIMLKTKLNRNIDKYYYITFDMCPSGWEFVIYEEGNKKSISDLSAENLVIPGNGTLYTSGHTGNFNVRRKYELSNNKIVEVEQPYYYVGLKSRTLNTINIYQTKDCKKVIATLPKDYEIEILLTEESFTPSLYLVRTSFGLVGWAKLRAGQYESIDVEGLFYNND